MNVLFDEEMEWRCLKCPKCGEQYLHHGKVIVRQRDGEDRDGIAASVSNQEIRLARVVSADIPGRRDSIDIYFSCEMCGGEEGCGLPVFLRISQHKGCTYLSWESVVKKIAKEQK